MDLCLTKKGKYILDNVGAYSADRLILGGVSGIFGIVYDGCYFLGGVCTLQVLDNHILAMLKILSVFAEGGITLQSLERHTQTANKLVMCMFSSFELNMFRETSSSCLVFLRIMLVTMLIHDGV